MSTIQSIGNTLNALNAGAIAGCNSRAVIATVVALTGAPVGDYGAVSSDDIRALIRDARDLVITPDGAVIPSAAGALKKMGIVVHTVKVTTFDGPVNALVYFQTKQGIIVIHRHGPTGTLLNDMLDWGVPERVKTVVQVEEKIVTETVQAPKPSGFFARLKFILS